MAPPGSLQARYDRLTRGRQTELYIARLKLGFTIDEWQALPWWHRRVYIEGLRGDAERAAETLERQRQPTGATRQSGMSGLDALYHGTLGDARAAVKDM